MPVKRHLKHSSKKRSTLLYLSSITLLISLMVLSTFMGFSYRTDAMFDNQLLEEARAFKSQVSLMRQWVWDHGGVYVSPNKDRLPRQLTTDQGLELRQLNPSEVTQQLSRLSHKKGIVQFTSTSLAPLNPQNAADKFEQTGLVRLQQGEKEVFDFAMLDNQLVFRYMTPVKTRKSCLNCHTGGDYQAGRIDSALSFTIPAQTSQQRKQTNRFWMIVSGIAVILLVGLTIWFLSRRFISQLEQADDQLQRYAAEDMLTGLLNRRMGMELLQAELARCERKKKHLSLMLLDIDHFKKINDTMGHQAGDDGIRSLAEVMTHSLRDYDIAFRYGGEEFIAILPDEDAQKALLVAERLRLAVENNRIDTVEEQTLSYTVSIGVAEFSTGMDVKTLIAHADAALYQCKKGGRNQSRLYQP